MLHVVAIVLATLLLGFGGAPAAAADLASSILNGKLIAQDGRAGDQFGESVAIDDDVVVVGAPGAAGGGAAYVFRRVSAVNQWMQVAKLAPASRTEGDEFGASVAIAGEVVMVGAPGTTPGGAAYVFARASTGADVWEEIMQLVADEVPDLRFGVPRFGASVSIDGHTAVIGAPSYPVRAFEFGPGAAYVFERGPSGEWIQTHKLVSGLTLGLAFFDFFGQSVSVSGNTIVVGAITPSTGTTMTFSIAHVFERDRGGVSSWGKVTDLRALVFTDGPNPAQVSLSGDTTIVAPDPRTGPVSVYERNAPGPDMWGLTATTGGRGCFIGPLAQCAPAVALHADFATVGNVADGRLPNDRDSVSVLFRNQGGANHWGRTLELVPADTSNLRQGFGRRVALDDHTAVAGTTGESVYVCQFDALDDQSSCRERRVVVNNFVSLILQSKVCCSNSQFALTAVLTNTTNVRLVAPIIRVKELTGGNLLNNADGGPGGVGATRSVQIAVLEPAQSVEVTFVILLQSLYPFRFVVDVEAEPLP